VATFAGQEWLRSISREHMGSGVPELSFCFASLPKPPLPSDGLQTTQPVPLLVQRMSDRTFAVLMVNQRMFVNLFKKKKPAVQKHLDVYNWKLKKKS
jgi:hypothetical protein